MDQEQASFGGTGGGYLVVSYEQLVAETFTAGLTGTLCRVAVHISRDAYGCDGAPAAPGDLIVELRSTAIGTAEVFGGNFGQASALVPTDVVLARTTLDPSVVPDQPGWVEVTFEEPARVLAGERYAIVLGAEWAPPDCSCGYPGGDAYRWTLARGAGGTDPYPRGQMFAKGREWPRWSLDELPSYPIYDDQLFKAYVIGPGGCGDGIGDPAEQCDDGNLVDGDCCSHDCAVEPSSTVCRPSTGPCDVPERCSGSDATCPPDGKHTGLCRPAVSPCDFPESCDGTSGECPADVVEAAGTGCRTVVGGCELIGVCDGTDPQCPADVCTAGVPDTDADGEYDPTDRCPGTAPEDPVDDAGCSLAQFCAGIDAATSDGARACRKADWRNDEPAMRGRSADCAVSRAASGQSDRRCVPVSP